MKPSILTGARAGVGQVEEYSDARDNVARRGKPQKPVPQSKVKKTAKGRVYEITSPDGASYEATWQFDREPTAADLEGLKSKVKQTHTVAQEKFAGAEANSASGFKSEAEPDERRNVATGIGPADPEGKRVSTEQVEREQIAGLPLKRLMAEYLKGPGGRTVSSQKRYRAITDEVQNRATSLGVNVGALAGRPGALAGGHLAGAVAGTVGQGADILQAVNTASAGGDLDVRDNLALITAAPQFGAAAGALGKAAIKGGSKLAQKATLAKVAKNAGKVQPSGVDPIVSFIRGESPVTTSKEPWQVTVDDYERMTRERPKNLKGDTSPRTDREIGAPPAEMHRFAIEKALSEGKPVPPEVLADYPDLAAKYKPDMPGVEFRTNTRMGEVTPGHREAARLTGKPLTTNDTAADHFQQTITALQEGNLARKVDPLAPDAHMGLRGGGDPDFYTVTEQNPQGPPKPPTEPPTAQGSGDPDAPNDPKKRTVGERWESLQREIQLTNPVARILDVASNTVRVVGGAAESLPRVLGNAIARPFLKGDAYLASERLMTPSKIKRVYGTIPGYGVAQRAQKAIKDGHSVYGKGWLATKASALTDVPFRQFHYRSMLSDIAENFAARQKGVKAEDIFQKLVKGEAVGGLDVDGARASAEDFAEYMTFGNDNLAHKASQAVHEAFQKVASAPGGLPGAGVPVGAFNTLILKPLTRYSKVIGNVATDRFERMFFGVPALAKGGAMLVKRKPLTMVQARTMSNLLAKGGTAAGVAYLGVAAVQNDWVKPKIMKTQNGQVFVEWDDIEQLGGPLHPFMYGATIAAIDRADLTDNQKTQAKWNYYMDSLLNQPAISGPQRALKAADREDGAMKFLSGLLASMVVPGGIREWAERQDSVKSGGTLSGTRAVDDKPGMDQLQKKIPWWRESLPSKGHNQVN